MASIQTGIELNDQFSGVLNYIVNSVNLAVSAMYDMQQSMNADIDTSSIQNAKDEINQTTAALVAMDEALNRQSAPAAAPPEPVEAPVQWQPDNLDVFTNTGIQRFQAEIQSTVRMMDTLNATQAQIMQTASRMDILPDAAVTDLTVIQQRLQNIQQRIQTIENNPLNVGSSAENAKLENLRSQLNMAVQDQKRLNQAMNGMDVSGANAAYLHLSQTISNTERYIKDNVDEQGRFNQEIQEGTQRASSLTDGIKKAVLAYASIQSVGKILSISDDLTMTTVRLNNMNQEFNKINRSAVQTDDIVKQIYVAAQDARGSFSDMANVVARFGSNARDAFSSQEEVIAFANLVQKQMTLAGAGTQEASNAMLQLSQALGSGVLRGDELNSIFEQAPNLIQSIADYLDEPIGKIREMAADGELTADIVKSAIFASADEINTKFKEMPMTWAQIWQSFQNTAMMAFQPVLQRINAMANTEGFQNFVNGAIEAMAMLAGIVLNIFDLLGAVGGFAADNWSIIEPIVWGVIGALAVYAAYLAITKGLELASSAASIAYALVMSAKAAIMAVATGQTMAAAAAQMGYNGALYACPIVWIIMLVIALIAIIATLCNWIAKATGAANSGIGIVVGALSVAAAFVGNIFVALINYVIDIFVVFWNFIAAFVNFFGNAFNDLGGSIARLFFDLVDTILGLLQTLAGAIDALFGSNLSGAVQGWRDNLGGWVDETFGYGEEIMAKVSGEEWQVDRFEYGEAWNAGAAVGDGIASAIDEFSLTDLLGGTNIPNPEDYPLSYDALSNSGAADNLDSIAGNTGAIKDSMELSQEDLKYLRDIAEQDTVNRFTLAEINIDQSGMQNNINSSSDIDGFMGGLTDAVNEAIDNMTEGVHE